MDQANKENQSLIYKEPSKEEQMEEVAKRVADLIWRHWLYMQEQKKKKKD